MRKIFLALVISSVSAPVCAQMYYDASGHPIPARSSQSAPSQMSSGQTPQYIQPQARRMDQELRLVSQQPIQIQEIQADQNYGQRVEQQGPAQSRYEHQAQSQAQSNVQYASAQYAPAQYQQPQHQYEQGDQDSINQAPQDLQPQASVRPSPASQMYQSMRPSSPQVQVASDQASYVQSARPSVNTYVPQTPNDNSPYRFDMEQHGRAMTEEDFTRWMKEKGIRVVEGR